MVNMSKTRLIQGVELPVVKNEGATRLQWFAVYVAVLLTILVLDMLWLGVVAKAWYEEGIGHLMAAPPNLAAAGAFYQFYPVGIIIFAIRPTHASLVSKAAITGALFGLFAYGTYDLSNLATLQRWPVSLALMDMTWGMFISAAASATGMLCLNMMRRRM